MDVLLKLLRNPRTYLVALGFCVGLLSILICLAGTFVYDGGVSLIAWLFLVPPAAIVLLWCSYAYSALVDRRLAWPIRWRRFLHVGMIAIGLLILGRAFLDPVQVVSPEGYTQEYLHYSVWVAAVALTTGIAAWPLRGQS